MIETTNKLATDTQLSPTKNNQLVKCQPPPALNKVHTLIERTMDTVCKLHLDKFETNHFCFSSQFPTKRTTGLKEIFMIKKCLQIIFTFSTKLKKRGETIICWQSNGYVALPVF